MCCTAVADLVSEGHRPVNGLTTGSVRAYITMFSASDLVTALAALAWLSVALLTLSHVLVWCSVRRTRTWDRKGAPVPANASLLEDGSALQEELVVTLLKPLCGVDNSLDSNLEGVARQTHSKLDVVFGLACTADAAYLHARRFRQRHPSLASRISIGETSGCINPKVALLDRMTRGVIEESQSAADRHWLVVSDSNVRLPPSYVAEALSHTADPEVGLVTHLVAGCGGDTWAAHCENLQLNVGIAPAVCAVRFLAGRTCVIGKSIFIRSDVLAALGGFQAVSQVLAEDYVLGRAVQRAGFRTVVAKQPVLAWHEGWTFGRFFNRHGRWAVMRRRISVPAYLLEPLLLPMPWLVLLLLANAQLQEPVVNAKWIVAAMIGNMALIAITSWRLTGRRISAEAWAISPLREVLTLLIWMRGWFVRRIEWRGKLYRIGKDSALSPCPVPIQSVAVWSRR